jgi:hypothetical protein
MRRILLTCALLGVLAFPAAAGARLRPAAAPKPGFLVVRQAAGDGGVNGRPVAVVVVQGFLLGRISHEARVDVYQLPSAAGQGAVQVKGTDVSTRPITWQPHLSGPTFTGREYTGSNFRFRAVGGFYRVVVRGSGIYLFAGGQGHVTLRGSVFHPKADGKFSLNGGTFRSLPKVPLTRMLGGGR